MKFSILIPAYKAQFLHEAISSIINQSYKDWELIILDDHSPQDLISIVKSYRDPRIIYHRNNVNFGAVNVVDNWNACLELANGDFVICMGDDDILNSTCLEEYSRMIQLYPDNKLFHVRTELIDEKGNCMSILEARDEVETTLSMIYYRWKGRRQYIGDFCFERGTLNSLGGFFKLPLAWASDDISAIKQSCVTGYVINSNKVLFKYRHTRHTITSSGNYNIKFNSLCLEQEWYKKFLNEYKPINDKERWILKCLKDTLANYFLRKKLNNAIQDISSKPLNYFKYLISPNKFGLNLSLVFYAFIMSVIEMVKNSKKNIYSTSYIQ